MKTNENYERVARWLDGEPVELTPQERALAAEIGGAEQALRDPLAIEVPPAALERARRRMLAAAARPRFALWRVGAAAGSAVAAAGIAAAILWAFWLSSSLQPAPRVTPAVPGRVARAAENEQILQAAMQPEESDNVSQLLAEVNQLDERLAAAPMPEPDGRGDDLGTLSDGAW